MTQEEHSIFDYGSQGCLPNFFFYSTAIFILALMGGSRSAFAASDFPRLDYNALIDARLVYTDNVRSWLDDGLGKARYGATSAGHNRFDATLAEASLILKPRFGQNFGAFLHIKYDDDQETPLDVTEAYFKYRALFSQETDLKLKLGAFFPPVSLENSGIAWSSPYTLSFSAINSWIGEEVKTIGLEATVEHFWQEHGFALTGALFMLNDPAGSLLAWRGWALHDRKIGLFDRLPLADIPTISAGGTFAQQQSQVKPIDEIDDNIGYYAGISWTYSDRLQLKLLHYDSKGDQTVFDGDQYAWDTRFTSLGIHLRLHHGIEILAQWMDGATQMGEHNLVDVDFRSFYGLLSKSWEDHRLSVRYDRFWVDDQDSTFDDNNYESGWAWTTAYRYQISVHQQLIGEALYIRSRRPVREQIGFAQNADELLLQINYRILF